MKLLLAALAALGLIHAPTAQATPEDDLYLTDLAEQGITYDQSTRAIEVGQNICADLYTGRPYQSVLVAFMNANPGASPGTGAKLIESSVIAYCPRFIVQLPGGNSSVALS